MDNRYLLYNLKPKINPIIYVIFISLTSLIIYLSINNYIYDTKEVVGINSCNKNTCFIKLTLDYNDLDITNKNPEIVYNKKIYKINKIKEEEPYLLSGIPSVDVTLETNTLKSSNIIKFKIRYNKQRIITKIKNILIERS